MTLLRPSRIAFGCSIFSPSRSQRLCCVVSSNASVSLRSHWNFPLSSLLYRSRKPSPSQSNPLIRSHRLPQNKNNAVLYGSNWSCALTIIASPSIERRRSVYPVAMYTCLSNARSFSITHVLMQAEYLLRYLQIIFLDTNIWVWSWNSYRYYCRFRFQTALPNFAKVIVSWA